MRKLLQRALALSLGVCLLLAPGIPAAAVEPAEDFSDKWELHRDEESGTEYYALDAVYCKKPVSAELQHLVIYAPKAYLRRGANGGVTLDPNGRVVSSTGAVYSAESAPILLHNTSGGYSSSKIQPVNLDYLREGYIHVSIQTRGKETQNEAGEYIGQFPLLIVDMKAGIRFLKHFDGVLPGNSARIVSRGFSSGGAVSAMLGASGNSPIFEPYLEEIGAYDATDDIFIALASAPITNLSSADASYEWYQAKNPTYFLFNAMAFDRLGQPLESFPVGPKNKYPLGSNILGGAHEDELAALLYDWYVDYVQSLGLDLGDDGRSGEFYEGFAAVYADALAEYIRRYDELRTEKQPATVEEYLKSLDSKGTGWFTYDAATGKVTITDLDALVVNHIARKKMCPSLDSYNYKSNENDAFKDASGKTVHFSATVRDALGTLIEKKDSYGWTAEELAYIEALYGDYNAGISDESGYLLEVMSPINYVAEREGFTGADVAPFWRLRIGSEDGDHGAPAAWLIAEGLKKYQPETEVSMGIAWGMGHSLSELTEQDLYDYIADIMLRTDALPDLGPDESASAVGSSQSLSVDGVAVQCPMVNIGGYNYFRLRDLAMLMRDTQAAFSVDFDAEARTVSVTTGGKYAPVGGELTGAADTASCVRSGWTLLVDGRAADVSVYNIGGSNYYKLRDLADAIGFDVDYINATRLVAISGKKRSTPSTTTA